MWYKESEKIRNGGRGNKVFQLWQTRPQEVGMPPEERKEEGRSSTTMSSMEEGEEAQWCKRIAPKGSSNVHGGMDHTKRSGNICGV